jgi:hypothetical protein
MEQDELSVDLKQRLPLKRMQLQGVEGVQQLLMHLYLDLILLT